MGPLLVPGLVPKKAFMDKFLDVFSDVVDKGLEKALKSGELDAALGPLASSGPVIMVAAIPMDEMANAAPLREPPKISSFYTCATSPWGGGLVSEGGWVGWGPPPMGHQVSL